MKHKMLFFGMVAILVGLIIVQVSLNRTGAPEQSAEQADEQRINVPDDPEMQAAFDKARQRLDYFLSLAESPPEDAKDFSVKVGVVDQDRTEFFWVYPFQQKEGGGFSGRINEEPELVDSVFKGQMIEFSRGQIVDWTFEDTATETMHGNYTGCVQLERQAPQNAQQFQELYGLDCDK